ncbi:uncharacterized protein LAESUDRAFT_813647 [Laetiporus sulphureus 93-53]|uniref:SMP domain-containing protein n=1 Tax=Laetiporus sulphureus 93-53 TaxID=1314785 RepID=A0A165DNM7_9APHY|nr:uncharacterized protein LAESUDRAFT_813647 [Laetiporus sulphureus 93-53]KZT05280.1 hypothetical protein LAESUDRAFT_813647 [Laetiporus sulphureus 93-53]
MSSKSASSPATSLSVVNAEVAVQEDSPRSTGIPAGSPSASIASARRGSIADAAGIDLSAIGKAEARKVMSEEHRMLGFRPPHGSLAAEVQAAAAKHPEGNPEKQRPDVAKLKELARQDAIRILTERKHTSEISPIDEADRNANSSSSTGGVNLSTISVAEARALMSHEHRALGFRPPPGSLAAEAQAAAAKHPEGDGDTVDCEVLKEVALRDAERIKADRELNVAGEVYVSTVGQVGAETAVSATEGASGHTPPPSGLAGETNKATSAHPEGDSFPASDEDSHRLEEIGEHEAKKLKELEGEPKVQSGHSSNKDCATQVRDDTKYITNEADDIDLHIGDSVPATEPTDSYSADPVDPANLATQHGVGTVLRSAAMVRSDSSNDSVQIIGDVVG